MIAHWSLRRHTRDAAGFGALLLAYYDPGGRLVYAGRAGTRIKQAELERLWRRLQPLATVEMPFERVGNYPAAVALIAIEATISAFGQTDTGERYG
jgi:ATP-dependent DNA ligase